MPPINVDLLLNRTLYAKGPVRILDSTLRVIETRQAGQVVGDVDSWVTRGGTVYLTLKPFSRVRLVRVPDPNLTLSKVDAQDVRRQQEIRIRRETEPARQELDRLKRQQGLIPYYLNRYGPILLAVVAGTYIVTAYIKKRA